LVTTRRKPALLAQGKPPTHAETALDAEEATVRADVRATRTLE
jgi:hypothetical protein